MQTAIWGAMLLVTFVGSAAFGRLILFGLIDSIAIWLNAYYGKPRPKHKLDPKRMFIVQRETGVYPLSRR